MVIILTVGALFGCTPAPDRGVSVVTGPMATGGTGITAATTERTDKVAGSPPSTPAELEQLITAFARCVEETFPIVVRFRTDPYLGMSTAIVQQHESEGEAAARVQADCREKVSLDAHVNAYELLHPAALREEQEAVTRFAECAGQVSERVRDLLQQVRIDTLEATSRTLDALNDTATNATHISELIAVSACRESALYGPERVFADGHPWFKAP